jgi:Fe2+ or Zn2+ uptake regulation protein
MTRKELNNAVNAAKEEVKGALQTVYDALNQGQQKKIVKNEDVKKLFDLYGVEYTE